MGTIYRNAGIVYPNRISARRMDEDDQIEGYVTVTLPMDKATVEWLNAMANDTGAQPETLISSMLKAIRADDQASHNQVLH